MPKKLCVPGCGRELSDIAAAEKEKLKILTKFLVNPCEAMFGFYSESRIFTDTVTEYNEKLSLETTIKT